jgi:lantibiotic modifying enzyme
MLHRAELHEPLTGARWDEARVLGAIRSIVADAVTTYDPDALWPADGDWDAWRTPTPLKSLYVGAAGVIWALDALARRGHAEPGLDLARAALRTLEAREAEPDLMAGVELPSPADAGLLGGESGVLLVAFRLTARDDLGERLLRRVRENAGNEACDVMWGAPGTMLAARAMLRWTGDPRWEEAWRESADALLAARDEEGLWTQRLYGEEYRGLGPVHGAVGNVAALLDGGELLPARQRETVARETADLLARSVGRENGTANWPYAAGGAPEKLQWCSGAPGIVVSAAQHLDPELLLAAAELVWLAGPASLEKGSSICHGTAGNGYALLRTFERTGDERWLERARRFAVHALEQVERARRPRPRPLLAVDGRRRHRALRRRLPRGARRLPGPGGRFQVTVCYLERRGARRLRPLRRRGSRTAGAPRSAR